MNPTSPAITTLYTHFTGYSYLLAPSPEQGSDNPYPQIPCSPIYSSGC